MRSSVGLRTFYKAGGQIWAVPDVILPNSLTNIEAESFLGAAFTCVKLPETCEKIGQLAFADCPNLAYIYIPEVMTNIDRFAFVDVHGLTILGKAGSVAESYANARGFSFVPVA